MMKFGYKVWSTLGLSLFLVVGCLPKEDRLNNKKKEGKEVVKGYTSKKDLSAVKVGYSGPSMVAPYYVALQSIIGYSELIRQQKNPQRKDIDAIYHSSEHLLQIVNEVLDYNRIISGRFTFSEKVFDIEALLAEVVSVMQPQAERKSLKLVTDFVLSGQKYVEGDPFRLKQILYNLLGNAIKFTAEGEVSLSAFYKRQGERLHFTFMVKDTGIGLNEEETKLIFNEFEQVNSIENEEASKAGAGLGLTIIKALIENQGGRIYVKSRKGEGSIFTVYLTFKVAQEPAYENTKVLTPAFNGKVRIVDDDQLILDLCEIICKKNATAADIVLADQTICAGNTATLSASSTTVGSPVFKWYRDASLTDLAYEGPTFTTPALTLTTKYYVTVNGTNACANDVLSAKVVTVTVTRNAVVTDIIADDKTICAGMSAQLSASSPAISNPVFTWYRDAALTDVAFIGANVTATGLTSTTRYYVTVSGTGVCANLPGSAKVVTVTVNPVPNVPIVGAGGTAICSGDGTTLTIQNPQTGVNYEWSGDEYDRESGNRAG